VLRREHHVIRRKELRMAKKKHNTTEEVEVEEEKSCFGALFEEWCMQLVVGKAGSYFETSF